MSLLPPPCKPRFFYLPYILLAATAFTIASSANAATTFYVSPTGTNSLSTAAKSPGSLAAAVSQAQDGSVVILENGAYDNGPAGFTVSVSNVTFEAKTWHGAHIINAVADSIWSVNKGVGNDVCLGIVFGPCAHPGATGWSGFGGNNSRFQDCEFIQNDGFGFGDNSVVLHCVFSDAWFNAFDVGAKEFLMKNTIVRRSNRINGDSDSVGNKESFANNLVFDGLINYDNEGPGLWFDTDNKDWTVKNSTFFANHGGANWYTVGAGSGISTNQFTGYGQDGARVRVGAHIIDLQGTKENLGTQMVVTAVTGFNPMTITVSPALPAVPQHGDQFGVVQDGTADSSGVGLDSEANPNGTFIDNVTYNNTDCGFTDNDSGGGYGVTRPGIIIDGNQFNYDGVAFRNIDGGPGNPTRKLGPASVRNNTFRVGNLTNRVAFKPEGTNGSFGFPNSGDGIIFDNNTYIPDPGYTGNWATWYIWTNYPSPGWYSTPYVATSLADLQNPKTFNQDQNSKVGIASFRGKVANAYIFPPNGDHNWNDIYCPNNVYGATNSVHQVNDDETPYIGKAISGKSSGSQVKLIVFGHTAFTGDGPFICDVYDFSGRYVTLTLRTKEDELMLDKAVPGFAVLTPSHLTVKLTVDPIQSPYDLEAIYPAS